MDERAANGIESSRVESSFRPNRANGEGDKVLRSLRFKFCLRRRSTATRPPTDVRGHLCEKSLNRDFFAIDEKFLPRSKHGDEKFCTCHRRSRGSKTAAAASFSPAPSLSFASSANSTRRKEAWRRRVKYFQPIYLHPTLDSLLCLRHSTSRVIRPDSPNFSPNLTAVQATRKIRLYLLFYLLF